VAALCASRAGGIWGCSRISRAPLPRSAATDVSDNGQASVDVNVFDADDLLATFPTLVVKSRQQLGEGSSASRP
jgi:hypothetical protein